MNNIGGAVLSNLRLFVASLRWGAPQYHLLDGVTGIDGMMVGDDEYRDARGRLVSIHGGKVLYGGPGAGTPEPEAWLNAAEAESMEAD